MYVCLNSDKLQDDKTLTKRNLELLHVHVIKSNGKHWSKNSCESCESCVCKSSTVTHGLVYPEILSNMQGINLACLLFLIKSYNVLQEACSGKFVFGLTYETSKLLANKLIYFIYKFFLKTFRTSQVTVNCRCTAENQITQPWAQKDNKVCHIE